MTKLTKCYHYFTTDTRVTNGEKFVKLVDYAPAKLEDFMRKLHFNSFGGCLSNDWIYETSLEAFEALESDKLEDISIEPDCYNHELIKWLENPFAAGYCEEARDEGLVTDRANIYEQIGAGQFVAKQAIYDAVNSFMESEGRHEEEA